MHPKSRIVLIDRMPSSSCGRPSVPHNNNNNNNKWTNVNLLLLEGSWSSGCLFRPLDGIEFSSIPRFLPFFSVDQHYKLLVSVLKRFMSIYLLRSLSHIPHLLLFPSFWFDLLTWSKQRDFFLVSIKLFCPLKQPEN